MKLTFQRSAIMIKRKINCNCKTQYIEIVNSIILNEQPISECNSQYSSNGKEEEAEL